MSGVGNFVLIDADTLEEANIVRHVADRRDVGRPKAEVLADLIHWRNPNAEVKSYVGRIEDSLDLLNDLDLLVVGVDGEGSKYKINEACLSRDLVAVYAGVYARGEGGDVVTIHPYDGPCYACWAAELREGIALGGGNQELDYGMIGPEGTLEAEPGLWLHVVRVAAAQADFALKELLRETSVFQPFPANTVILANNAIEIIDGEVTPPHSAVWVDIARDPNCLVCGEAMHMQAHDTQESESSLSLADLAGDMGIEMEDEARQ
jgi:molybdopterin/thiamine biosynthesis adenylyltransferase